MDAAPFARSPLDQVGLQAVAGPQWQVAPVRRGRLDQRDSLRPTRCATGSSSPTTSRRAADGSTAQWVTPPGAALTFSAVFDPVVDTEWWPVVPLVAGYAVATRPGELRHPEVAQRRHDRRSQGVRDPGGAGQHPAADGGDRDRDQRRPDRRTSCPSRPPRRWRWRGTRSTGPCCSATWCVGCGSPSACSRGSPNTFMDQYRGRSATLDRRRPGRPSRATAAVEGRAADLDPHGRLVLDTARRHAHAQRGRCRAPAPRGVTDSRRGHLTQAADRRRDRRRRHAHPPQGADPAVRGPRRPARGRDLPRPQDRQRHGEPRLLDRGADRVRVVGGPPVPRRGSPRRTRSPPSG